jgi:menaquinone-9 beta-reductase
MKTWDVAIAGAGPCGSMAALAAARAGLDCVLIDRVVFPRHKVCGDCLNPSVLPIFEKFGLTEKLKNLPHSMTRRVEFHAAGANPRRIEIDPERTPEMVVQRRDLDAFLLQEAGEAGVSILTGNPVRGVSKVAGGWVLQTGQGEIHAKSLIVADGRNSTVARLLNLLPAGSRGRIGWQAHVPLPERYRAAIAMFFMPFGYGGLADCGGGEANLCVVSTPENSARLKREACSYFGVAAETWQSMSPIHRKPARVLAGDGLFLAGDAARVVEPFTGEGIYYAIRTGVLAGEAAVMEVRQFGGGTRWYLREHPAVYRGRMWVNQLSCLAGQYPAMTTALFRCTGSAKWPLALLTRKVVSMPGRNFSPGDSGFGN